MKQDAQPNEDNPPATTSEQANDNRAHHMPESQSHPDDVPASPTGWRGTVANALIPLLMLIAAAATGAALINSPPAVPKSEGESPAPVVGIQNLVAADTPVFIDAFGTVRPARELPITPEVGGRIVELNPQLEPGGLIKRGELLLRIDPADYEIDVAQAEAGVDVAHHEVQRLRARVESLRARGRQLDLEIAYLQWNSDRLGQLAEEDTVAQYETRDAVTQLKSRKVARRSLDSEVVEQEQATEVAVAGVRIAERRLEAAKLALQRTRVSAPFDAIVISEDVELGRLVQPQTPVAKLAATDAFWVEAAIPVAHMGDIRFATDHPGAPSRATVHLANSAQPVVRQGQALRALGSLDPLGRMGRVLVSIRDPLVLAENRGRQTQGILIGSYVRLRIESQTLQNVYAVPRKALRENDCIWVRDAAGQLAIRAVDIVWRRQEDVLVHNAFQSGDQLITTHLASVVPGMPLLIRGDLPSAASAAPPTTVPLEAGP